MNTVTVELGSRTYPIYIKNSYKGFAECFKSSGYRDKLYIITDENVDRCQGESFISELRDNDINYEKLVLKPGEEHKNLDTMRLIYDFLHNKNLDRNSVIAALGGGVIGDMTGFAAATFLRGIDFLQVPTSLLAQADSSVGGKTGIDFKGSKNIIGAFYQPKFVYINVNAIKTLPEKEIQGGLAETIKHGLIQDAEFYGFLKKNIKKVFAFDEKTLIHIAEKNCLIKSCVVSKDEKESGLRAILNFGHTFGHAIETVEGFRYTHGECVSLGMVAACYMSEMKGFISSDITDDIKNTLESAGLPVSVKEIDANKVYSQMFHDKKLTGNVLNFILIHDKGKVAKHKESEKDMVIKSIDKLKV
jgi:3-dehydroquinate synthase